MLTGTYVNFAVCNYYNDTIFTDLSRCVLNSVSLCDKNELCQYQKVDKRVYQMLQSFCATQLVHLFTNFETSEIEQVLHVLRLGANDRLYEAQSDSINALSLLNEFIFEHLKKKPVQQGHKNYKLQSNIYAFAAGSQGQTVWSSLFSTALASALYIEKRNTWIFEKWMFSSLVILMEICQHRFYTVAN